VASRKRKLHVECESFLYGSTRRAFCVHLLGERNSAMMQSRITHSVRRLGSRPIPVVSRLARWALNAMQSVPGAQVRPQLLGDSAARARENRSVVHRACSSPSLTEAQVEDADGRDADVLALWGELFEARAAFDRVMHEHAEELTAPVNPAPPAGRYPAAAYRHYH
jgi:hypothetical protein